ncbi:MAG: AMP-binding protein, partial [bacterium]|nr:AMP-binding protein [bacterium]
PIDRKLRDEFAALTPAEFLEGYGLSECSPIVSVMRPGDPVRDDIEGNCIGAPLPGTQVKICSENGEELSRGLAGEIVIAGPQVMAGYYQKEEATKEVLENGWLKTGDIGVMDENGLLYFMDREKDLIKVLGENIYASHIERVLLSHPAVVDVVVCSMPHAKTGETPVALVMRKEGALCDASLLRAHVREALSSYHVPSQILFLDSLDQFKNAIGKVLKRHVREYVKQREKESSA